MNVLLLMVHEDVFYIIMLFFTCVVYLIVLIYDSLIICYFD
jgi:hypothetical protein